jgi:hypothetical protein
MKKEENRREPAVKLSPEQIALCVKEITRPKMLHIEVHWRTQEAVKANPGSLRIICVDANGNTVIERPHRPRNLRTEPTADRTDFETVVVRRQG